MVREVVDGGGGGDLWWPELHFQARVMVLCFEYKSLSFKSQYI